MIYHTFFDKCNTLLNESEYNTGLNPVAELNCGDLVSRVIFHFDIERFVAMYKANEIQLENLTHRIKMTNCGSVNLPLFNEIKQMDCNTKERAASFDVIVFTLPYEWDEGRGFDYHGDYVKGSHRVVSKEGSNWFNARGGMEWDEPGIYSNEALAKDYMDNYKINDDGIIVGRQHFDNGTEDFDIDVTDIVNRMIKEEMPNNGFGIAFSPRYEKETKENKFISFFTNHTNTFFHPYLETVNKENILDDRTKFHLGVTNRLYLYVGDYIDSINLDEMPTCTVEGREYEVKQAEKGVYYVEIKFGRNDYEPETMLSDIWSNIKVDGVEMDDVEMEFVVLPMEDRIQIGRIHRAEANNLVPSVYGIDESERIIIGDIREVFVDFIEEYSNGKKNMPSACEYRLYVKEGKREIDVFPYQPLERRYDSHSFLVNTNDLIPNTYYVDVKVKQGKTVKNYSEVLSFAVVSNVTHFYI